MKVPPSSLEKADDKLIWLINFYKLFPQEVSNIEQLLHSIEQYEKLAISNC